MLPKIQASVEFVEGRPDRRAVITSIGKAKDGYLGKTGTYYHSINRKQQTIEIFLCRTAYCHEKSRKMELIRFSFSCFFYSPGNEPNGHAGMSICLSFSGLFLKSTVNRLLRNLKSKNNPQYNSNGNSQSLSPIVKA